MIHPEDVFLQTSPITGNYKLNPQLSNFIDPSSLSESMLQLALQTFYMYVKSENGLVDDNHLVSSEGFRSFNELTPRLRSVRLEALDIRERAAFFINIYNCLVVHIYAIHGVAMGLGTGRSLPATLSKYQIGDSYFTLDDIKHGILRGNQPRRRRLLSLELRQWETGDPRLKYALPPSHLDPRIHFTLCKHTRQSPVVRIFRQSNMEAALRESAEEFCSKTVTINEKTREIFLPKLFWQCYSDFGKSELEVLRYIMQYLSKNSANYKILTKLLKDNTTNNVKIIYTNDVEFMPQPFHQTEIM